MESSNQAILVLVIFASNVKHSDTHNSHSIFCMLVTFAFSLKMRLMQIFPARKLIGILQYFTLSFDQTNFETNLSSWSWTELWPSKPSGTSNLSYITLPSVNWCKTWWHSLFCMSLQCSFSITGSPGGWRQLMSSYLLNRSPATINVLQL